MIQVYCSTTGLRCQYTGSVDVQTRKMHLATPFLRNTRRNSRSPRVTKQKAYPSRSTRVSSSDMLFYIRQGKMRVRTLHFSCPALQFLFEATDVLKRFSVLKLRFAPLIRVQAAFRYIACLLNNKDICKAGHLKDLHYRLANVYHLH